MPVCSYLVFPRPDAHDLVRRVSALPGCEVTPANNADLLILVTDTSDAVAEAQLQVRLQDVEGIQCTVLTFGDLEETGVVHAGGRKRSQRRLPEDDMEYRQ